MAVPPGTRAPQAMAKAAASRGAKEKSGRSVSTIMAAETAPQPPDLTVAAS